MGGSNGKWRHSRGRSSGDGQEPRLVPAAFFWRKADAHLLTCKAFHLIHWHLAVLVNKELHVGRRHLGDMVHLGAQVVDGVVRLQVREDHRLLPLDPAVFLQKW